MKTVAIVGRPNVGKSTLFNRLVGHRRAIVDATPGVTRDRLYGTCEWRGRRLALIDTGGVTPGRIEELGKAVRAQMEAALAEADLVLFLVDAMSGVTPLDREVARLLRARAGAPILVVVNKAEGRRAEAAAAEWYALGFPEVHAISAEHGIGVGDLLDRVVDAWGHQASVSEAERPPRIAVVGRPNVGKSTLVNRMLGSPRVVVAPDPGTTRDTVDTLVTIGGVPYVLIDTAGIRARRRVSTRLERVVVVQTLKSLERCDLAVLLLDASSGIVQQDARIARLILDAGCASIVVVNKWDLVGQQPRATDGFLAQVREKLRHLDHAPVLFISALTGRSVTRLFPLVARALRARRERVPTPELNRWLTRITKTIPPPAVQGRPVRLKYTAQVGGAPPTFLFFVQGARGISSAYERFLANRLREAFGFEGNPIRLLVRTRGTSARGRGKRGEGGGAGA